MTSMLASPLTELKFGASALTSHLYLPLECRFASCSSTLWSSEYRSWNKSRTHVTRGGEWHYEGNESRENIEWNCRKKFSSRSPFKHGLSATPLRPLASRLNNDSLSTRIYIPDSLCGNSVFSCRSCPSERLRSSPEGASVLLFFYASCTTVT